MIVGKLGSALGIFWAAMRISPLDMPRAAVLARDPVNFRTGTIRKHVLGCIQYHYNTVCRLKFS